MSKISLDKIVTERLPGGLGIQDAKALLKAAGKSHEAVVALNDVLKSYEDSFTKKGLQVFKKALAALELDFPPANKVSEATHRALLRSFEAVKNDLFIGEALPGLPLGQQFVTDWLVRPMGGCMPGYSAYIPCGALTQNPASADPNKATEFYVCRTGGLVYLSEFFGPFPILRDPVGPAITVGEEINGKTVKVPKGLDLVMQLPANASTGFQWVVTGTDKEFGYPEMEYILDPAAEGMCGSGGTAKLTWKTGDLLVVPGQTHLVELSYIRTWEPTKPAKVISFAVEII